MNIQLIENSFDDFLVQEDLLDNTTALALKMLTSTFHVYFSENQ